MASNLPPGCKLSDIPGNRPEDIADEQIRDNIHDALAPLNLEDNEQTDKVIENLFKLINNAHESGYAQCKSDADEQMSYLALQHVDDSRLDDSPKYCPECETPNQFGELCERCKH